MSSKAQATLEVPRASDKAPSSASTLRGDDTADEKKSDTQDDEGTLDGDEGRTDVLDDVEYPSGMRMFFIVTALVMSVFLFSLDLVSQPAATSSRIAD